MTSRCWFTIRVNIIFRCSTTYPETTFGGDFETEADYTDPYVREVDNAGR